MRSYNGGKGISEWLATLSWEIRECLFKGNKCASIFNI